MLLNNQSFLKFPTSTPSSDPYFSNVVLYLKGDGTNGSTSITDSSNTPKTITVNGNTQISTAQSKYGGSSILFDGNGDYLSVSPFSSFDFGTGNGTIEAFVYPTALGGIDRVLIDFRSGHTTSYVFFINGSNALQVYGDTTLYTASSSVLSLNTMVHIALVKSGSNWTYYINGVASSGFSSSSFSSALGCVIGIRFDMAFPYTGYIDSFRITKEIARYSANFNPETDTYMP